MIETLSVEYDEIATKIETETENLPGLGNFKVIYVDRGWGKEEDYRITLKTQNKDGEVNYEFDLYTKSFINRLSWSSWSFSEVVEENVQKSRTYLSYVMEALEYIQDRYEGTEEYLKGIENLYIENIKPLNKKSNEVYSEIQDLKRVAQDLEETSKLDEAKKWIRDGAVYYFYDNIWYSARKSTRVVYIKTKKNGKMYGSTSDDEYGYKFNLDDNMILELARAITKTQLTIDYNQEGKNEDGSSRHAYFKWDNLLTKEQFQNFVSIKDSYIEIDEEEYKSLKKLNR